VVITLNVRDQVRQSVTTNLESSQRMFAALETRRQRELRAEAANFAESPTLKAATDTYGAEAGTSNEVTRAQLLATMENELAKLAVPVDSDVIVLVDAHQKTLASAGRLADRWPAGRSVALAGDTQNADTTDGVVHLGTSTFRVVTVPLLFGDAAIGTLYLATSLDRRYAEELDALARTRIAPRVHRGWHHGARAARQPLAGPSVL